MWFYLMGRLEGGWCLRQVRGPDKDQRLSSRQPGVLLLLSLFQGIG